MRKENLPSSLLDEMRELFSFFFELNRLIHFWNKIRVLKIQNLNLRIKNLRKRNRFLLMEQNPYSLKIYVVETLEDFECPPSIISLSVEECKDNVDKVRNKIYDLLFCIQDPNNPLAWKTKYNIYLEDGKQLDMEDNFSIYFDDDNKKFPPLYFSASMSSLEFLEKKLNKDEKKLNLEQKIKREAILKSLQINIKDLKTFDNVVSPKFQYLLNRPELEVVLYPLNLLQQKRLNEEVSNFKDHLLCKEFFTEPDRDDAIARCITLSLVILRMDDTKLYENLKCHHQFSIEPDFPYSGSGTERIADFAVYEQPGKKIINLNEVKKKDGDLEECIRQNADQLRAFCICFHKKIGRGIATTGEKWIFTQYNKSSETFKISQCYECFKTQFGKSSFQITDNYKVFFEVLLGFIVESVGIMSNN